MKKNIKTVLILIFISISFYGQDTIPSRFATIKNKIDLLKVEVAGLEEKLNVNITNTSLANFLLAVSKIHKVNINVSQQLNNINIANGFTDVTVGDLLVFLVKEYDLDIDFTGNIISVKPYKKLEKQPVKKEINAHYDLIKNTLDIDLNNEPLDAVFRKIMKESGRNLLYSPNLNAKKLSAFIQNVPFDTAIDKLSLSNGLEFEKTEDGFYVFNRLYPDPLAANDRGGQNSPNSNTKNRRIRPKRKKAAFYYEILDEENKYLAIDVKDASVSDLIMTLADEFDIDIFLASPIENVGTITIKSERIHFDDLLTKIFENSGSNNRSTGAGGQFTFKKERKLYFFGTENQLTLNSIQFIPLQFRSIELLGDPSSNSGATTSRLSGSFNNNNGGGVNFINNGNRGVGQSFNNGLNSNSNTGFNARSSSGQFNTSRNERSSFENQSRSQSSETQSQGAITSLFPDNVLEGLDVKVDVELNGFIVSGAGTRVEKFKKFTKYIDKPVPVILLDVMILEVSKNATVETGLEIGIGAEETVTRGTGFPSLNGRISRDDYNRFNSPSSDLRKIIGGFNGFSSTVLGPLAPNFYIDLKAEESNGNLKILSTPKLSTLNGHKAYLSSGQTTYYEIRNQSFIGSQNPQSTEITNYQPIDAELAIEFKPYVAGNGQITLDIQVIQSSFGNRIDESAPPDINSRRFSSIIRMQENDVAILGGLEEKFKNDSGSGVPFLSRIPILKWFFSQRSRTDSKSKLNILIKPTVFY